MIITLPRWFKRRRPAPAPAPIPTHDVAIAHAWGFTLTAWQRLTDQERAGYRYDVAYAPNFRKGTR